MAFSAATIMKVGNVLAEKGKPPSTFYKRHQSLT